MVLVLEGTPHMLEDFHTSGTAQTRHKMHCRLRNLNSNRFVERIFPENERTTIADLLTCEVRLSYMQGEDYVFSDTTTYEELHLSKAQVGERHWFMKEDQECKALFVEGKLQDIVLPLVMALRVTDTAPATKGGTAASWKPAVLETGLEIMVPLFIEKGESVRVDTQARKYLGKEAEDK